MNGGGGATTQSTTPEVIKAVRVQTSAYGVVRPLVYGTTRVTMNLLWYGDLVATPIPSQGGGGK